MENEASKESSPDEVRLTGAVTDETEMAMVTEIEPAPKDFTAQRDTETNTSIHKFSINSSKDDFLALPHSDAECDSVDSDSGLWIKCAVCDKGVNWKAGRPYNVIPCRVGRPFTLARWIDHKATDIHKNNVSCQKRSSLEQLESNGTISRLQRDNLNQLRKKQKTIGAFFLPPATTVTTKEDTCGATIAQATKATEDPCNATNFAQVVTHAATQKGPCNATTTSIAIASRTCEGIIIAYKNDKSLQKKIQAYVQYCSISSSTTYVAGTVQWNGLSQVFADLCTPNTVTYQMRSKVYQCLNCCHLS
jgi:hypothetical protein